ncbi:MAG: hypothetical protein OCC49_12800 [Fibrobacterales bacterium]
MLNHNSDNKLDHRIFNKGAFADSNSPMRTSAPSGGGGGFGGSSGSNNSSASSSNRASQSESPDSESEESPAQPQEEEEEAIQEQLVTLSNLQFIEPETATMDGEVDYAFDIEYLTDMKPPNYTIAGTSTYKGNETALPNPSLSISGNSGKGTFKLPINNDHYMDPEKTPDDKVTYTYSVTCDKDSTSAQCDTPLELSSPELAITLIEVLDTCFSNTSPIPVLDSDGMLLKAIAQCYAHLEEWPDKIITVYGHCKSDTAEPYPLSEKRATAIKALIANDSSLWGSLYSDVQVEDYQQLLTGLADLFWWPCDPLGVDNTLGDNTQFAIKGFQQQYSEHYKPIKVSGSMNTETWGAFCTVLYTIAHTSSKSTKAKPRFYDTVKGVFPCGSNIPIADTGQTGFTSTTDARLELQLHESPVPPTLPAPSDAITAAEIPSYNPGICEMTFLDASTIELIKESDALPFICAYLPCEGSDAGNFIIIPEEDADQFFKDADDFEIPLIEINKERTELLAQEEPDREKLEENKKKFTEHLKISAKPKFEELIVMNRFKKLDSKYYGKRQIKSDKMKTHWRRFSSKQIEKEFDTEVKKIQGAKPKKMNDYVQAKVKSNWWALKNDKGQPYEAVWKVGADTFGKDNEHFDAGYEYAVMRAAVTAEVGAEFDPKEMKLSVSAKGEATASLIEGKVYFNVSFPDEKGFNLIDTLHKALDDSYKEKGTYDPDKSKNFVKRDETLYLLIKLEASLYGFVGANAAISLPDVNLNFANVTSTDDKPKGRLASGDAPKACATVGVEAFAGAQGTIDFTTQLNWSKTLGGTFKNICKAGGALTGRAGIGVQAFAKFSYENGKIVFTAKANLVVGLGGGGALIYELNFNEGIKMISHLMRCFNYHNAFEIADDLFELYLKAIFIQVYGLAKGVELVVDTVEEWFDDLFDSDLNERIQKLTTTPIILHQAPPEILGPIIGEIINRKAHSSQDYENILSMLEQSKAGLIPGTKNHELGWIIRYSCIKDGFWKDTTADIIKKDDASRIKYLQEGNNNIKMYFSHSSVTTTQKTRLEALL